MITIITGGTGSIKLLRGLNSIIKEEVNIIVNVGDNINLFGVYICPDIDTTLYGLSNKLDIERGWGIKDDTFNFLESRRRISEESWFQVGDKDLATHVRRTNLMENGLNLTEVTDILSKEFGIKHKIIPASNDRIETTIITDNREMHLQEFWVKNKGKPEISDVIYNGIDNAKPAQNVIKSIEEADKIIISPGNPISSIGPTICIKQIRDALQRTNTKKIVISPIMNNKPISGPAGRMMKAKGYEVSVMGVAEYYRDVMTDIVIDRIDKESISEIEKIGKVAHVSDIMMNDRLKEIQLAEEVMKISE